LRRAIPDIPDGIPYDLGHIDITLGGDFTGYKSQSRRNKGFAGDPTIFILSHNRIQDGVGYGIGDLIRMAFRHGFRRK
jgi:hypothetical protein